MERLRSYEFSVLLSLYIKEKPECLKEALNSIYISQTLKPNEIILVEDGPLTKELEFVLDEFQEKNQKLMKRIKIKENIGLGKALNEGLKECSYELVARMDTDDISKPDRFKKQIELFENNLEIDIASSWIDEFIGNKENIVSQRKVPESHQEISEFIKSRNPINHPVVMFKKSKVIEVGNYLPMHLNEDYYLWGRMMVGGAIFYNIQESLLWFRSGSEVFKRRGGWKYAKADIELQKEFYKMKLIKNKTKQINIVKRILIRILPMYIRKKIYIKVLRDV